MRHPGRRSVGAFVAAVALAALTTACRGGGLFSGVAAEGTWRRGAGGDRVRFRPVAEFAEVRGVDPDVLSQEARLLRASATEACFEVTLRSPNQRYLDWSVWSAEMRADVGGGAGDPRVTERGRRTLTYDGLVPIATRTGFANRCKDWELERDCRVDWQERLDLVRGPVEVHEGTADLCFRGDGLIRDETRAIDLRLQLPLRLRDYAYDPADPHARKPTMMKRWSPPGIFSWGPGIVLFRWRSTSP
jgi:hypothetical protein